MFKPPPPQKEDLNISYLYSPNRIWELVGFRREGVNSHYLNLKSLCV